MEGSSRTHQRDEHNADRRVRELYRYCQPAELPSNVSSWFPTGESLPATTTTGIPDTPPAADGTGSSASSATSRPSTIGPETLILGTANSTLTSFAQLAALRLNVDRALVCVLDRNMQYIIAEATKSVSLGDSGISTENDEIWLGTTGNRKAWSLCQVSFPSCIFTSLSENQVSDLQR